MSKTSVPRAGEARRTGRCNEIAGAISGKKLLLRGREVEKMVTITFYSYKGGSGRSLALANAAVYLAKLGFRVVALDFDLEVPGVLHYKFSRNEDASPLAVERGIVDYVNDFRLNGEVSLPLKNFAICVPIAGIE